ncbi:hypothetical protein N9C35_03015 [Flavobacteriaceae bacterium]|nr:hypothetical protein [Flavobacteriaceae bacterium]
MKFLKIIIQFIIISYALHGVVLAKSNIISDIFSPKKTTPSRKFTNDISVPKKFHTTNNLVRKSGSFYIARGEIIYIKGTITDSFGVPISGVVIEIWQTNSIGKYQSLLPKDSDFFDKYFAGSGRAVTDNFGNYSFITVMPGSYLERVPHINFNVYHPKFGKIETEMYFDQYPDNLKDYHYLSYSREERSLITAEVRLKNMFDPKSNKIFKFDMVMEGVHLYKNFGSSI